MLYWVQALNCDIGLFNQHQKLNVIWKLKVKLTCCKLWLGVMFTTMRSNKYKATDGQVECTSWYIARNYLAISSVWVCVSNIIISVGDRVAIEPGVPCRQCYICHAGRYNLCGDMKFCATPPVDGNLSQYFTHPEDFCFKWELIDCHVCFHEIFFC